MRRGNYGNSVGTVCTQCKGYHDTLQKFLHYFSKRKTLENPTLDESHIELIQRANASRLGWRERESRLKEKPSSEQKMRTNAVTKLPGKSKAKRITHLESQSEEKLRSIEVKLKEAEIKCKNVEVKLELLRLECNNYISKVIDTF